MEEIIIISNKIISLLLEEKFDEMYNPLIISTIYI